MLSELPGFSGYSLVDAGNGVMTSVGFFDTAAQAEESTRVAGTWLREQKLETALPSPPKITSGDVVAHKTRDSSRPSSRSRSYGEGPHMRAFSASGRYRAIRASM